MPKDQAGTSGVDLQDRILGALHPLAVLTALLPPLTASFPVNGFESKDANTGRKSPSRALTEKKLRSFPDS